MKIIQIMPEFGLAGAEVMCEALCYELAAAGHRVIVVSMYDYHSPITERLESAGIEIRYLNKKSGLDLSMIGKMRRLFRAERPDVIHTHRYVMQYAIPAAILARVKRRVHTVHNVADQEVGRSARMLNRIFYRCFSVTPVALSERVKQTVVELYSLKEEKVPVVLNGIDLSACMPKEGYEAKGDFTVLHIGRFSEQKNHLCLLEAFEKLHRAHADARLQLIGDGERREEIERFIAEHGLGDCVALLGLQSRVHSYLHDADVFVLPSLYEGIPMTLIEAMGTGLPIVASRVGGVPDMIADGEQGLLCEPSAEHVAACLERLYTDESLRERLGAAALEGAERFSSRTMAQRYSEIYLKEI